MQPEGMKDINLLNHSLSLQLITSSGTSSTRFVGKSATTTTSGWPFSSLVTTTSTPGWPSPKAAIRSRLPAGSRWGRTRRTRPRRLWCRPTAAWSTVLRTACWSHTCARPRRERWSHWRVETSWVSGYKTSRWSTTKKEPQRLGCTNCRTPEVRAYKWNEPKKSQDPLKNTVTQAGSIIGTFS